MTIANNIESNSSICSHKKPRFTRLVRTSPRTNLLVPICVYIYIYTHTIYIYICIHTSVDNIHFELDLTWINNQLESLRRGLIPACSNHQDTSGAQASSLALSCGQITRFFSQRELVCPTNHSIHGVPGAFSRRL